MLTIKATVPCHNPPSWAVWERKLLEVLDDAVYPFLEKYCDETGSLLWRDNYFPGNRDGADDFYESFGNWPLLYLLGGGNHLLPLSLRQWEAITRQLTALGLVYEEYELGYDQFHQSESYTYFYYLCLADPTNPALLERAARFASLYLGEDAGAANYDPVLGLIRAPHNGSGGPRWGWADDAPYSNPEWIEIMRPYGLPFQDVPGITKYDDLKDPALARRMEAVIQERMGKGDVAANLSVTSLITNCYLMHGDEKYRRWVLDYVDRWQARAEQNGGLLPDNVGLSGQVGEYINGKWYGGLYGWSWPHGYYSIEMAASVAAFNAFIISQDKHYLELPRRQTAEVLALGQVKNVQQLEMQLGQHWVGILDNLADPPETLVVPICYGDQGWYDYEPLSLTYPLALWNVSMQKEDWATIQRIQHLGNYDWRRVVPFRNKEDGGHEQPWISFLRGENPDYPVAILSQSYGQVSRRLEQIRQDQTEPLERGLHHWQELNPVTTEALVQLTLGAPQPLYNGGLLLCRLRYFDAILKRPGIPKDVAALVIKLEPEKTVVKIVNLNVLQERSLIIQAGAFGEHQFEAVTYSADTSPYPGQRGSYTAPPPQLTTRMLQVGACYLQIDLPPATEIELELITSLNVCPPSYQPPWENEVEL